MKLGDPDSQANSYPILFGTDETPKQLAKLEDVGPIEALPTSILLDGQGMILRVLVGAPVEVLRSEVTKYYKH